MAEDAFADSSHSWLLGNFQILEPYVYTLRQGLTDTWLTEELETVRSGLEKQPFGLYGWLEMDMHFYSNASDNRAVIMDSGDLLIQKGYEPGINLIHRAVNYGCTEKAWGKYRRV